MTSGLGLDFLNKNYNGGKHDNILSITFNRIGKREYD